MSRGVTVPHRMTPVRMLRTSLLVVFSVLCVITARAQMKSVPFLTIPPFQQPLVELDGPWQFHLGDDRQWASPAFDDSGWKTISTDEGWDLQGYPATGGYGWYRRHIQLQSSAGGSQPLAIPALPVDGAYQVYWNGVPVGGCGSIHPLRDVTCWNAAIVPASLIHTENVLAFRVFSQWTRYCNRPGTQGLLNTPELGTVAAADADRGQQLYEEQRRQWLLDLNGLLYALLAIVTFFAWLQDREEYTYLWLSCLLAVRGARAGISYWRSFAGLPFQWEQPLLVFVGYFGRFAALCMLLLRFFRLDASQQWRRFTFSLIGLYALLAAAFVVMQEALPYWNSGWCTLFLVLFASQMMLALYPIVLIVAGLRRRTSAARWCVAATATITLLVPVTANLLAISQQWTAADKVAYTPLAHVWGATITLTTLSNVALLLSLAYAAAETLIENRRHRMETALELRSAAEVQRVLLPDETQVIPGFRVEAVYRPAGQVGGDFFQVLPLGDGGVLLVIGDVSGKGMPAAMTVALLVGALRSTAAYTQSPAALLAALNQRMVGRGSGFTTCLAVRLHADGAGAVANAGHLQPYLDGEELPTSPGLPLGLLDGAAYDEVSLRLAPGSRLLLLTDGVVEARDSARELFGFARTRAIARERAEVVAQAGAAFGQNDDITVLTVVLS